MKYLFFIIAFFLKSVVFGQHKVPKFEKFVNELIMKGANGNAHLETKENFSHFYAIAFSFDTQGKIDTLYYSKKLNPETKKLYALDNSLLKRIKTHDIRFKEYSSKIVLVPFFYYNATDKFNRL